MKKGFSIGMLLLLMLLNACKGEVPKEPPEVKKLAQQEEGVVEASSYTTEAADRFTVKHHVKGQDVYFECLVKDVTFRNDGAKIILYNNGKRWREVRQAAFIAKGLPEGRHNIKLKLVEGSTEKIIAEKEMEIEIK